MKIKAIILIILISPISLFACDICGCGVGNSYIGVLPEFQQQVVGIRYRTNSILTHLGVGSTATHLTTAETYRIAEIWGGWNINDRWRIMLSIPYSYNQKTNQQQTAYKQGLGDISVLGYYQLLNRRLPSKNKLIVQSLWLGGGVQFATGQYRVADRDLNSETINLFQLGTGSTDFMIQGMYDIRLNDIGMNVAGGYKINTPNTQGYHYGNRMNLTLQLYHKFKTKNGWGVVPNLGIQFEQSNIDKDGSIEVFSSGGQLILGTIGAEISYKKISIGGNFQTPFKQNLANNMAKSNDRWMIHVAYVF